MGGLSVDIDNENQACLLECIQKWKVKTREWNMDAVKEELKAIRNRRSEIANLENYKSDLEGIIIDAKYEPIWSIMARFNLQLIETSSEMTTLMCKPKQTPNAQLKFIRAKLNVLNKEVKAYKEQIQELKALTGDAIFVNKMGELLNATTNFDDAEKRREIL